MSQLVNWAWVMRQISDRDFRAPRTIPGPEELTPELLAPLLQQVKPEQCNQAQLDVRHLF